MEITTIHKTADYDLSERFALIEKAKIQDDRVMLIFNQLKIPMTPRQVLEWYNSWFNEQPEIGSIRRSITNLTTADKLSHVLNENGKHMKVKHGLEHLWRLP